MSRTKIAAGLALMAIWMLGGLALVQAQSQQSLEDQLRAFTPDRVTANASEFKDRFGNPRPINLTFQRADLDGNGQFNFFVVVYNDGLAAALRVLRTVNGQLQVAADLPDSFDVSGTRIEIELDDVDKDGKPEIMLSSFGVGVNFTLWVFKWTGTSLVSLTGQEGLTDGELFDVDRDGVLEIVTSPVPSVDPDNTGDAVLLSGTYKVYKFDGTQFKLASESVTDPTGQLNAAGELQSVFAHRAVLDPGHFPLAAIQNAIQGNDPGGVVTLRLGNLTAGASPDLIDVTQVDPDSLRLNRSLHALSAIVVVPSSDDAQTTTSTSTTTPTSTAPLLSKFQGAVIQATFSRADFLKLLPRAQTDAPLAAGQSVNLDIDGKMKNGTPLFGVVKVQIVPE